MRRDLDGVKVGDSIRVSHNVGGGADLYQVERVTATQAVCGAVSFRIETGLKIGTGSGRFAKFGRIATEKDIAAISLYNRICSAKGELRNFAVTADNLEAVEALLKAGK